MKKKVGLFLGILFGVVVLSISFVAAKNGVFYRETQQSSYQVANLSCGSCLATIEEELSQYKGMVGLTADLGLGVVTVEHTEEFDPQAIAEAITFAGYPAQLTNIDAIEARRAALQAQGGGQGYGCGSRGCGSGGCGLPAPVPQG